MGRYFLEELTMAFDLASRKAQPVLISLGGRSGSGKTYSALLLAKGLVGPNGKIAVIDTERGRASMYADDPRVGAYFTDELHPPFSPGRFIEKFREAAAFKPDCLIIDSASHEWSGIGGVLEQVDKLIEAKGQGYRMPAWGRLKPQHNQFVNNLTMLPFHVICCVRAKKKMVEQVNADTGKKEWIELPDLVAEQQENFIFEMTASALIDDEHNAKWVKVPEPLKGVLVPGVIKISQGEAIRQWVNGGASFDQEASALLAEARQIAENDGIEALRKFWTSRLKEATAPAQAKIESHKDELVRAAREADRIRESAKPEPAKAPIDPFADKARMAGPEDESQDPTAPPAPAKIVETPSLSHSDVVAVFSAAVIKAKSEAEIDVAWREFQDAIEFGDETVRTASVDAAAIIRRKHVKRVQEAFTAA